MLSNMSYFSVSILLLIKEMKKKNLNFSKDDLHISTLTNSLSLTKTVMAQVFSKYNIVRMREVYIFCENILLGLVSFLEKQCA
jgi:hypothetical protein